MTLRMYTVLFGRSVQTAEKGLDTMVDDVGYIRTGGTVHPTFMCQVGTGMARLT